MNIYKATVIALSLWLFVACGGGEEVKQSLLDKPFNEVINMSSTDLEKATENLSLDEKKNLIAAFKSSLKPTELKINQIEKAVKVEDPNFTGKKKKKSKLVSFATVEVKDIETFTEIPGTVQTKDNTDTRVMAETTGRITKLGLYEDRYLKKGDFVMSIDDETVRLGIAEQETQLKLAQTVLEKRERLWEQKIGTEIELIQARTNVEALQKSIATTKSSLDKFTQNATVNGTIDQVFVSEGEMVMAGTPIAAIINLGTVTVEAELNESYLGKVKRGDRVMIEFPSLEMERQSKITDIGSRLDAGSRTFTIEMDIANKGYTLKPNIFATVKLRDQYVPEAVVVPTQLVQEDFEGSYIYVAAEVEGERVAQKVRIETGAMLENEAIVTSGLNGSEILIEKGYRDVVEGQPVEVSGK